MRISRLYFSFSFHAQDLHTNFKWETCEPRFLGLNSFVRDRSTHNCAGHMTCVKRRTDKCNKLAKKIWHSMLLSMIYLIHPNPWHDPQKFHKSMKSYDRYKNKHGLCFGTVKKIFNLLHFLSWSFNMIEYLRSNVICISTYCKLHLLVLSANFIRRREIRQTKNT